MEKYAPSGYRDGHCGVCEQLEVHVVCLLEGKCVSNGSLYCQVVNVQPILEVGEVDEQYPWLDTDGLFGDFRVLL